MHTVHFFPNRITHTIHISTFSVYFKCHSVRQVSVVGFIGEDSIIYAKYHRHTWKVPESWSKFRHVFWRFTSFLSAADRRRRRRCMSGNVRPSVCPSVCLSVPPHSRHLTTFPKSYQCEIAMVDAYCCKQHSGIGFMVEWFPVFQLRSKNLWFLAIFSHFCELLLHFWSKGANIAQEHSLEPP